MWRRGVRTGRAASMAQPKCLRQFDVMALQGGMVSLSCIPVCDIIISQGTPAIIIGAADSAERASWDDAPPIKANAISASRIWRSLEDMELYTSVWAGRGNGKSETTLSALNPSITVRSSLSIS